VQRGSRRLPLCHAGPGLDDGETGGDAGWSLVDGSTDADTEGETDADGETGGGGGGEGGTGDGDADGAGLEMLVATGDGFSDVGSAFEVSGV
jgi:hypothetical protein